MDARIDYFDAFKDFTVSVAADDVCVHRHVDGRSRG